MGIDIVFNILNDLRIKDMHSVNWRQIFEKNVLQTGDQLLYLSIVGSQLYGTDDENSDLDLMGVYLPAKESLLLGDTRYSYAKFSTCRDKKKNNSSDIDIELWSIHKFMDLLQKGDTNAYDLLFSKTDISKVLYSCREFSEIFKNRSNLIGFQPIINGFIGYAANQVKRYISKGRNYRILSYILNYFNRQDIDYNPNDRLDDWVDSLIKSFQTEIMIENSGNDILNLRLTFHEHENNLVYLKVNDYKKYPVTIRMKDFLFSIKKWTNKYGSRVKNSDGIDWTSIYHAFRVLHMAHQLDFTGDLNFPFDQKTVDKLLNIKYGNENFDEVVKKIEQSKNRIEENLSKTFELREYPDEEYMQDIILNLYSEECLCELTKR